MFSVEHNTLTHTEEIKMRAGNTIQSNTFQGYTTIVLEIENNIYFSDIPKIREALASISIGNHISYDSPLQIINKHDEDLHYGFKFVVLSNQNDSCINSVIDDIMEILA
jgi:hypothetical protein